MMIHDTRCPPNIMGAHAMPKMPRATVPKPKTRPSQSQPFDPDELSRKLYTVLAEQKAYAERKRRAKAKAEADRRVSEQRKTATARDSVHSKATSSQSGKEDSPSSKTSASRPKSGDLHSSKHSHRHASDGKSQKSESTNSTTTDADGGATTYRHIPQVAASQFSRTTKSEEPVDKHLVHRLSRSAMKFHLDGPNASREMADVGPESSPCEQAKALRRAQSVRERLYERNQFQHPSALHTTLESDEHAVNPSQGRSFDAQIRPRWIDHSDEKASRRISTGTFFGWDINQRFSGGFDGAAVSEKPELSDHYELAAHPEEHRVDWTQSDETVPRQTATAAPRKQESRWALKSRIVNFNRHSKEEKAAAAPLQKVASDESSKWSKSGFFARFKR